MKKSVTILVFLAAAASLAVFPLASDAAKKGPKKTPAAQEAAEKPAYEATGPSAYCLEHPSQCKEKHPEDRPVKLPHEHCIDVYGNGDGFVSEWEVNNFGMRCR